MPYQKFVLPFAIEDFSRKEKPFNYDSEVSALVCLAEGQRKKIGFLGGSSENIAFISKIHYPFLAVPFEEKCLIMDGLNVVSYKKRHLKPPPVEPFVESLIRNSSSCKDFLVFLKEHSSVFRDFASIREIVFSSVMGGRSLLDMLLEYMKEGTHLNGKFGPDIIPLELDKEGVERTFNKFIQIWRQDKADIKGLQYAIHVLEEEKNKLENKLILEKEFIVEKYGMEISKLKLIVEENVKNIVKKQEIEIVKATTPFEKKLKAIYKEEEKYNKKLADFELKKLLLIKKVEAYKRKKSKTRTNYEIKVCQSTINEIKRKIKASSNLIESAIKEKEKIIQEIEEIFKSRIDQEEAKITGLMNLRDSKIAVNKRELEDLTLNFTYIKSIIEQLKEQKTLDSSKLQEETLISWKQDKITLIYLPFYLIKYEKEKEARYYIIPPILAMGYEGILRTIKKAIFGFNLKTRIDLLLHQRSKELSDLISSILNKKMLEDKNFEEKISQLCISCNIFNSTQFKNILTKGIEGLAEEGWITLKEETEILGQYGGL